MLVEVTLFGVGLAALILGADRLVDAGAEVARFYGVSTFFIGVTIISVGTSIPEMVTSVYAAYYGAGDIAVGNIIGSETAQITLAIGIVALVSPIVAERRSVVVYGGAMTVAMVIMMLTLEDGVVQRSEGVLMMLAYVNFIYTLYTNEGGEEIAEEVIEEPTPPARALPWVLLGLALVAGGGHLLVDNGVELARNAGVSEYFVGLLTGLGTTTPEIFVAGMAASRGDTGISVGSILGSNITDPVFSLGIGALVADVVVTNQASVRLSATYMLGVSLVVVGLLYWRRGIDRPTGILCLLLYLPGFVVL
ncbi:MAG: sodium:calcium antiporter [Halobacteriota archaeon]